MARTRGAAKSLTLETAKTTAAYHDNLPAKVREYLADYPLHVTLTPSTVFLMGEDATIAYLERKLKNA